MDGLLAGVAEHWRALDPLLPAPALPAGDPDVLVVPGGAALTVRRSPDPDSPLPMWFAAHRFSLRPLLAGPDVGDALDRVLTGWQARVAADPHAADDDSAAYVFVPSREAEAGPLLLRHGLAPYVVIAVRPAGRQVPRTGAAPTPVRQARGDDLDAVVELALTQAQQEAPFFTPFFRPDAAEQIRAEMARLLDAPTRWVWLAEAGGRPVGLLAATPPEHTDWLAPYTDLRPAGYVSVAYVDPAARGTGVGAALAGAAHAAFDEAGVAATLLHYSLLNPRSGPFWHRMGYRPLWTGWQARPASTLR